MFWKIDHKISYMPLYKTHILEKYCHLWKESISLCRLITQNLFDWRNLIHALIFMHLKNSMISNLLTRNIGHITTFFSVFLKANLAKNMSKRTNFLSLIYGYLLVLRYDVTYGTFTGMDYSFVSFLSYSHPHSKSLDVSHAVSYI